MGNDECVGNIVGKSVLCLCREASSETIPGLNSCTLGGETKVSRQIATKINATATMISPA